MKKNWIFSLVVLTACARVPERPDPLASMTPRVEYIAPADESTLSSRRPTWVLFFSKPIDSASLDEESLILTQGDVNWSDYSNAADLNKAIEKGRLAPMSLRREVRQEGLVLVVTPTEDLEPGTYTLLATSRILSIDRFSLNQNSGGTATPFLAHYQVNATSPSGPSSETVREPATPISPVSSSRPSNQPSDSPEILDDLPFTPALEEPRSSTEESPHSDSLAPTAPPSPSPEPSSPNGLLPDAPSRETHDIPSTPVVSSPSTTEPSHPSVPSEPQTPAGPQAPMTPQAPATPSRPVASQRVVINEIYYDAVGSDTDGVLFVELWGTPNVSLSRYRIDFVNGDDGKVYDSIVLPEDARIPASGFYVIADARTGLPTLSNVPHPQLIDNFDPQNGPDAVQLSDASGHLLDALGYGDEIRAAAENGLATFEGNPAPDVVNGHSLGRRSPGADTGDNRIDFIDQESPTPGE